jgi:hypothetical protein
LPEIQRSWLEDGGVSPEIWDMAARFVGPRSPDNLERRLEIAKRILKSADRSQWFYLRGSEVYHRGHALIEPLHAIHTHDFLTYEELLAHGPQLAAAASAGGLVWAALADLQQTWREHREAAAQSWGRAVAGAPKDDRGRQTQWRINHAEVLNDLGRRDEARAVLDSLTPEMIDPEREEVLDRLRNELGERPEQNDRATNE